MMLRMYSAAQANPARKINDNLLVTGVGIISALVVGVIALSTLLTEQAGVGFSLFTAIASLDTEYAGYLLAALFAVIGVSAWLLWRRAARAGSGSPRSPQLG